MRNNHLINDSGQSLVEVIVAATVGIIVVVALTFATIFSLRNANFAKNSAQATKLAQEGLEKVRIGRDRDQCIVGMDGSVQSWNGGNSSCGGNGSIWAYQIDGYCGNSSVVPPTYCYLGFNGFNLQWLASANNFPNNAEDLLGGQFKRVVILSDNPSEYTTQKTVTVIVLWNDTTGPHESKLTTILRKL